MMMENVRPVVKALSFSQLIIRHIHVSKILAQPVNNTITTPRNATIALKDAVFVQPTTLALIVPSTISRNMQRMI